MTKEEKALIDFVEWMDTTEIDLGAYSKKEHLSMYLDQKQQLIKTYKSKKPTPYRWVKNQKLNIPEGATFKDDKCITIRQCASWISEYNKVNESQCNDIVPKHILHKAWESGAKWSEDAIKGNATVPFLVWLEDNYPEYTK